MRELKLSAVVRLTRFKPDRFTLFLGALGLLGAVSVLLREVTYGVLLNADGLIYISVARNLLVGEGFVDWEGGSYMNWAPLWPSLLAIVSFPGLDPHDVSGFVNAATFGVAIFVSGWWLKRHVESHFLVIWTCLAIMVPITLTYHATTAFSETLFVLFITLSLIVIDKFLNEDKRSLLIWAAVWAALACFTRYVGVTLVFASVLLLAVDRSAELLQRAKRVTVYLLVSLAPLCLWMLRNLLLTGHPMGPRGGSSTVSLLESVRLTVDGVGGWVVFPLYSSRITAVAEQMHLGAPLAAVQSHVAPLLGVLLLMLATGAVVYGLIRLVGGLAEGSTAKVKQRMSPIVVFGVFALFYLVFLTVAKSLTIVDDHARHYAPAYIPFLLMAVVSADRLLTYGRDRKLLRVGRWLPVAAGVTLSLWIAYHGVVNALHAMHLVTEGIGYQSRPWTDSETMRYVEARGLGGHIYSQSRRIMHWHLCGKHWDRSSADVVWDSLLWNLPLEKRRLSQWVEELRLVAGDSHVVWFNELRRRTDYDAHELMALPGLELVAELSDGFILRVRK